MEMLLESPLKNLELWRREGGSKKKKMSPPSAGYVLHLVLVLFLFYSRSLGIPERKHSEEHYREKHSEEQKNDQHVTTNFNKEIITLC